MPSYTITATCGGESATHVVTLPDLTGTVTTTVDGLNVTATISGLTGDATVTVDWGDGTTTDTATLTGGDGTAQHAYADAAGAPYTVTVTGTTTGAVLTAPVTPFALVLDIAAAAANPLRCEIQVSNIPGDETGLTGFWGDTYQGHAAVTGDPMQIAHNYAEAGTYDINVVGDDTGVTGTGQFVATAAVLAAPTNLAVDTDTADPPGPSSFTVQFDPVDGATGYTATATGGDQTDWPGAVDATGDTVVASFASLEADTQYTVEIVANGDGGTTTTDSPPETLDVSTTAAGA